MTWGGRDSCVRVLSLSVTFLHIKSSMLSNVIVSLIRYTSQSDESVQLYNSVHRTRNTYTLTPHGAGRSVPPTHRATHDRTPHTHTSVLTAHTHTRTSITLECVACVPTLSQVSCVAWRTRGSRHKVRSRARLTAGHTSGPVVARSQAPSLSCVEHQTPEQPHAQAQLRARTKKTSYKALKRNGFRI